VAILGGYSRKVLAWVLGTSREAMCCVGGLEEALRRHDRPSVFNTDPGLQNTRAAFTRILGGAGVALAGTGRGTLDNLFSCRHSHFGTSPVH